MKINRFEIITKDINALAEFFAKQYNICEKETGCKKCKNQDWCNCETVEDYRKWLEK